MSQEVQDKFIKQILNKKYGHFIEQNLKKLERNKNWDVSENLFKNIKNIVQENIE